MSHIEAQKTAPSLKTVCQDAFISRITPENSVEMLILADMHKDYMETVKKEAILMILNNGNKFLKREKLVASTPSLF